jgi:sulfur carrier protein ThiS
LKQEITYNGSNVSRHDIFRGIRNIPGRSVIMMLSLMVIVVIGYIGHEELGKAQSDDMNMNPIIMHIHPQLSLIINNTSSTVPAQIGIDPSLWKDHSLDEFGMQPMPEMKMSAMAPLHTHDDSGIVHVESTVNRNYTLEEFLNIWGLNLDGKIVKMTLNGKPLPDFRDHILSDGEQIKLEVQ